MASLGFLGIFVIMKARYFILLLWIALPTIHMISYEDVKNNKDDLKLNTTPKHVEINQRLHS